MKTALALVSLIIVAAVGGWWWHGRAGSPTMSNRGSIVSFSAGPSSGSAPLTVAFTAGLIQGTDLSIGLSGGIYDSGSYSRYSSFALRSTLQEKTGLGDCVGEVDGQCVYKWEGSNVFKLPGTYIATLYSRQCTGEDLDSCTYEALASTTIEVK